MRTARFTVIDALSGLFRLEKRSPTLRGSVPLRVAQACLPLLEGNAFGFQVTTTQRLPFSRGALGWSLALSSDEESRLVELYARGRQRLIDGGILQADDPWLRVLETETLFGKPSRRLGRRPRLRLWTGLLVRPDRDVALRLFSTANRRAHGYSVVETSHTDGNRYVPLILELSVEKTTAATLTLAGEMACLAPLPTTNRFAMSTLAERPEVGRAHAEFYSPSYFQKKEAAATRRYRKQIDVKPAAAEAKDGACEVITVGPPSIEAVGADHLLFRNLLDFSFRFDGATVALDFDREVLKRKSRVLWQRYTSLYGREFVDGHEGALLYLGKYFTTHPPGEPHFFVKPWAFTRTPPGWSTLIDGCHGDGYDVMRGVVATDQFHATPAVFAIHRADEDIAVPAETPLCRLFPLPRSLLHAGFRLQTLAP